MSTEFKREERYIVVKLKDLTSCSSLDTPRRAEEALREHLRSWHIQTRECVVVESDWPEYETVWRMIEARVTGAAQAQALRASVDVATNRFEGPLIDLTQPSQEPPPGPADVELVHCPHACGAVYVAESYGAGFIEGSGMCPDCDAVMPPKDIVTPDDEPTPPELLAAKLIDAWVAAHRQPVPWEKAVEITAITTSMSNEERNRLLAMADEPVAQAGQAQDEFGFEYRHPNGERHTVRISREQVLEEMPDSIFEALCAKFCHCEPIGETNVVECCCDEYAEEFQLVAAAPKPVAKGDGSDE